MEEAHPAPQETTAAAALLREEEVGLEEGNPVVVGGEVIVGVALECTHRQPKALSPSRHSSHWQPLEVGEGNL